ncbi:MAG: nucleotidyltransferase family protein [Chloroflexi bacterium]|nr:nucleotidyltransferase family protein [Chloroflexota bacterium]
MFTNNPSQVDKYIETLRQLMPELQERYKIKSLGVFGSYVRGEQRKRSDLDLLVEFHEAPSLFEFLDLEFYLTDLLGVKVDLVMKSALKPAIGRHILEELIPI